MTATIPAVTSAKPASAIDTRIPATKASPPAVPIKEPNSATPMAPPTWRAVLMTPEPMPARSGPVPARPAVITDGTVRAIPTPASRNAGASARYDDPAFTGSMAR